MSEGITLSANMRKSKIMKEIKIEFRLSNKMTMGRH